MSREQLWAKYLVGWNSFRMRNNFGGIGLSSDPYFFIFTKIRMFLNSCWVKAFSVYSRYIIKLKTKLHCVISHEGLGKNDFEDKTEIFIATWFYWLSIFSFNYSFIQKKRKNQEKGENKQRKKKTCFLNSYFTFYTFRKERKKKCVSMVTSLTTQSLS